MSIFATNSFSGRFSLALEVVPTSNAREKRPGDEVVFAGYVPLAFQNSYPIIVYIVWPIVAPISYLSHL